jgi:hypothetical protein
MTMTPGQPLEELIKRVRVLHNRVGRPVLDKMSALLDEMESVPLVKAAEQVSTPDAPTVAAASRPSGDTGVDGGGIHHDQAVQASSVQPLPHHLPSAAARAEIVEIDLALVDDDGPLVTVGLPEGARYADYRIDRVIGRGSRHIVYAAIDLNSAGHRMVALHIPLKQQDTAAWVQPRWRLAKLWLQLRHSGVVAAEDAKWIDKRLVYVTELVDHDGPLVPPVDWQQLMPVVLPICEAFAALLNGGMLANRNVLVSRKNVDRIYLPGPFEQPGDDPMRDIGRFLSRLLTNADDTQWTDHATRLNVGGAATWLFELVSRSLAPPGEKRFVDTEALLEFIRFRMQPARASRSVITSRRAPAKRGVEYEALWTDRDTGWKTHLESALFGLTSTQTLRALAEQWTDLGQLSKQRARAHENGDEELRAHLEQKIRTAIEDVGEVGGTVLGDALRKRLAARGDHTLTIVHGADLAALPWELFDANGAIGLRFAVSRRFRRIKAPPRPAPPLDPATARVLVLRDPTHPACEEESRQVAEVFRSAGFAPIEWTTMAGVTRLRREIARCDILHFAGHGRQNDGAGHRGLLLADGDVLSASHLQGVWGQRAPLVVFANACGLGHQYARAACATGVTNFLGTPLDPPQSDETIAFALAFYTHLLSGRAISHAVLEARCDVHRRFGAEDLTWARYVLFGDPFTSLQGRRVGGHR